MNSRHDIIATLSLIRLLGTGWRPSHDLEQDLAEMYAQYAKSSRSYKDLEGAGKFKMDDAILAAL